MFTLYNIRNLTVLRQYVIFLPINIRIIEDIEIPTIRSICEIHFAIYM
jgi:hypothetical protein